MSFKRCLQVMVWILFQIMNDEQTYILFASMMDLHTASVYELSAGHKIKSLRSYM